MQDYIRRILVVVIMAACIGMLFIGGRSANAEMNTDQSIEENWSWPITGIITDTFGTRNGRHKGLDIAAPLGEEIYAVEEGTIKKSYYSTSSYGNIIIIEHPSGFETVYAHLSKRAVQEGDQIEKGQIIGEVGSTGRSTGPHLHFEIHNGEWNPSRNNAINPQDILMDEQKSVVTMEEEKYKERIELLMTNLTKGYDVQPEDQREAIIEATTLHKEVDTYTVHKGDTLSEIAQEVGITVDEIMDINNLQDDLIFPDQILIIN